MANTFNKEKFTELVSKNRPSDWAATHKKIKAQRSWKKNSAIIALNVLTILEQKEWSQARLAEEMNVSAAQVSKIVKGQVNFTLESIAKLETALGRPMLRIPVIDPEREQRNYTQLMQWLEKSRKIKTTKSSQKRTLAHVAIKTSFTSTRSIPRKDFNMTVVADDNLRPTG